MSRDARLRRLEGRAAGDGRCPACPPIAYITVDSDGDLLEGEWPKPCSRCGGPHDGSIRFIQVVVPADADEPMQEGLP